MANPVPLNSVEGFFDTLEKSNLLTPEQMAAARQNGAGFPDAKSAALALIGQNLITKWQVGQLLVGRHALFLGKYKLLDKIGAGGMGAVYRAEQIPEGRFVAIKVMNKNLLAEPEALRRFLREARAAAALSHPNVVSWIDHGTIGPTHYLAMEYVRGRDLGAWIDEFGRLPIDWSAECIRQAALGLQHAHERGMVHRDIKPSNILVCSDDANSLPVVKILDLGLARFPHSDGEHSELTKTGQIMGTPDYMSVEQAENTKSADIRSDIFSLGCTLFKLLTGELPYKGDTAMEKLIARVKYDAPLVSRYRPETPHKLAEVVARMLAREPKDRFQTPGEVAQALAPFALAQQQELGESSSFLRLKLGTQASLSLEAMPDPGLADVVSQLASRAQPLAPAEAPLLPPKNRTGVGAPSPAEPAPLIPSGPSPVPPPQPVMLGSDHGWISGVGLGPRDRSMFNPQESTVPALEMSNSDWRSRLRAVPLPLLFAVGAGCVLLFGLIFAMTRPGAGTPLVSPGVTPRTIQPGKGAPPAATLPGEPARAIAPFDAAKAREHQDAWARFLKIDRETTNGIGMKLMLIPPGEFDMGTSQAEIDPLVQMARRNGLGWIERNLEFEKPVHRVTISRAFYIGQCEVTQEEYKQLVPDAAFGNAREGHPADRTSWTAAVTFCNLLSEREKLPACYRIDGMNVTLLGGKGYRLPTEAEWEYACRAGTQTAWSFGDSHQPMQQYGWVNHHDANSSHVAVGTLKSNPWSLHDMHGNTWEWCWDVFQPSPYGSEAERDPLGFGGTSASGARQHVLRGGGYVQTPLHCRSAMRLGYGVAQAPTFNDCGFRVVRDASP